MYRFVDDSEAVRFEIETETEHRDFDSTEVGVSFNTDSSDYRHPLTQRLRVCMVFR